MLRSHNGREFALERREVLKTVRGQVWLALSVLIALLIGPMGTIQAQNTTTPDVDTFWEQLGQTRTQLDLALTQSGAGRASMINRISARWGAVEGVRVNDQRVIPINTAWLRLDQDAPDDELRTLRDQITALLAFRTQFTGTALDTAAMLATLEDVLADDQFQYRRERESNMPTSGSGGSSSGERIRESSGSSSPSSFRNPISPGLAQFILMLIGAIVVVVFAYTLFRALRVQPAAVDLDADEDDIPPTSDAATDRAEQAQTHQDYRVAIRYLYLASLLLLDERGVIRFDPALTNYEHLRQLSRQSPVRPSLGEIVGIFDRVWYGFAPVDEALYQHFRQLIDQLKQVTMPYEASY